MKRFHVHVSVHDLARSIRFYTTLFGAEPVVVKDDYAKWMLEDPRVNFAISTRASARGVDHLGLQVESGDELAALEERLRRADAAMSEESNTTCCYARSDKRWVTDPQGVAWETFHTLGSAPVYGEPAAAEAMKAEPAACCGPTASAVAPSARAKKPAAACCG